MNHYNSALKKCPILFFLRQKKKIFNYLSLNTLLQNCGVLQNSKHLKSKAGISIEIVK